MNSVLEIGQGTRQVEIALNLTVVELAALVDLKITAQDPAGIITTLILPKTQIINNILYFPFLFEKNGDYTIQTTLNFGTTTATSSDALVLRVNNPVQQQTLMPMGKYINKKDLETYLDSRNLTRLSDRREGETGDNTKIQQAIEFAESKVESYLSRIYAMPLLCSDSKTPQALKQVFIELAIYNMFEQRVTEETLVRYNQAIAFLSDLAGGKIDLVCSDGKRLNKVSASGSSSFAYAYEKYVNCGCNNVSIC